MPTTEIRCVCAAARARARDLYGHLEGRIVWLTHRTTPTSSYCGTLHIPQDLPGYLYLDRGDTDRSKTWHHQDIARVSRVVYRLHHPDDVHGDITYVHRPDDEYLHRAHHRGWVTGSYRDENLLSGELSGEIEALPGQVGQLLREAHAADRPWRLDLSERIDGVPAVVVLAVQGLDPQRPQDWTRWQY